MLPRMNRRRILACLPAAVAATPALAFRLEAPGAEIEAEYGAACPAQAVHEVLRREIEDRLDGRPIPPPELRPLARCPFCGCGVLGAADHGEGRAEGG
jgi:hypothetical protein